MWRTLSLVSLLVTLSVATSFAQVGRSKHPFSQVGRSAIVERRDAGGDSSTLAVENGWVIDVSWLAQVPASRRASVNVPGLIQNGVLINPAPAGSKAGTQVGSPGAGSSSSSTKCSGAPPATSTAPVGAGTNSTSSAPPYQATLALIPANSSSTTTPPSSSSVPNAPGSSSTATPTTSNSTSTGAGGCPANMKAVTFNGGYNPGMFDTIAAATNWITFAMGGDTGASSHATAAYIPMMAFASDVANAVSMVQGPNPPEWMLTFNEPDYSYAGVTPTMSAQEAADAIKPLLDAKPANTKFVAPVTADPTSSWLTDFYTACGCQDFFSAYNIHIYTPSSASVEASLTAFHTKFSDKPLWLTEIAPGMASPPCSLGWDTVNTFMQDVYRFAAGSKFVDRVFWNTGNQIGGGDHNVCNSYLLDSGGNPSPLLAMYQAVDCQ